MKTLHAIIVGLLLFSSAAVAEVWDEVTISATVYRGGTNVQKQVLANRDYLALAAAQNPPARRSELVVALRESTGQVAVIRRANGAVLYIIVTAAGTQGLATNTEGTRIVAAGDVSIASLDTAFAGFAFATTKRTTGGEVTSANIAFSGGSGTRVIKGTCTTTGAKFNF